MNLSGATVLGVLISVLSVPAIGSTQAQAPAPSAPTANPISQAIKATWDGAKRNLKESAEQMAEADYAFRPTEQVRTFGEILAHVAGANYVFCAPARGEKPPFSEDHFEKTTKTKAEITKAVVCGLSRCTPKDVERAGEAVKHAKHPRIHVFCATSKIHREHKL